MASARDGSRIRWIAALGGLALLIALFVRLGPRQILALSRAIGPNALAIVGLFACHECVRAVALGRCLANRARPPFRRLLGIRLLGEAVRALTHTGPLLAEPARAWMLAQHAPARTQAYGAVLSELIANSGVSAAVMAAALALALDAVPAASPLGVFSRVLVAASLAYLLAAAIALARRIYLISAIARAAGCLPIVGRALRADPHAVRQVEEAIIRVLTERPVRLVQVVLLELLAQAILVLEIYWTLVAMGLRATPRTALVVESLTKLANAIHLMGAAEGGYALVFTWLGMAAAVGFTLSLVKRARSLVVAALGVAVVTGIDGSFWKRASDGDPQTPT